MIKWEKHIPPNPDNYAPFAKKGTGEINGDAFLKTVGGEDRTGGGNIVTLDPATPFGEDYMRMAGRTFARWSEMPPFALFQEHRRTTTADGGGSFEFQNLPPGDYFVRTYVTWHVPNYGLQGGILFGRVTVEEGKVSKIVLRETGY